MFCKEDSFSLVTYFLSDFIYINDYCSLLFYIIVRVFVEQTSNHPIFHHFANFQIIVKLIYYAPADLFKVR